MRLLIISTVLILVVLSCINSQTTRKTTKKITTKSPTTSKKATTAKKTTKASTKLPQSSTKQSSNRPQTTNFTNTIQNTLNKGLKGFHEQNRTRLPRNQAKNRTKLQSNMRQTSDDAFFINQIANFAFGLASNSNNLSIDLQYCPFVTVKCNINDIYRSVNGSCNNLKNPLIGAANTPYKRVLPPAYDDGFNSPRTRALSGKSLPNVRTVSVVISPPPTKGKLEFNISHIFATFGQFLIHDMSGTSASTDSNGNEISCSCGSNNTACFPVVWPKNDTALNQTCMEFTRSSATFPDFNCSTTHREQLNLLSSYIDGSAIYGIDTTRASELRSFTNGLLKTSDPVTSANVKILNGTYLPNSNDSCSSDSSLNYKCFLAGEFRTSENLALVSMHTLFNREHNRIAQVLKTNNPLWTDEKLYQEARRINIAILQHIVYNEWLNYVDGNNTLAPNLSKNEYYNGYNSNVNPALFNEFSTAAFRFGHSLIRDKFSRISSKNVNLPPLNFSDMAFKSDYAYDSKAEGIQSILSGTINDRCWKFGSFGFELQNRLFGKTENNIFSAVDLLATNIQRGRDHGLQPYVKYVKHCHGIDVTTFDDLKTLILSPNIASLQSVYENVADIDLYAGGLMEKRTSNFTLAPATFACIVMKQMTDLKNGDRFYYENGPNVNPSAFSLDQLAQIKQVTLAGLICNNYDLPTIPQNVFLNPSTSNPIVNCSSLTNQINLSKWTSV
ncbi:unnamed protein product [Brachionus calyciflorus]|uniref:Uncharacterized protein n=1 Tax=Brachionus calyciflorus TaxID=104777 RepID=A0A814BSA8_9BILA|nr:unnamed protein product [Brachionus calyciflorus]